MVHIRKPIAGLRAITISLLLLWCINGYSTSYKGTVYLDRNVNGKVDLPWKGLGNLAVLDGLNVVLTDAKGNSKNRFLFGQVSVGYNTSQSHWLKVADGILSCDFGFLTFPTSVKMNTSFIQFADTEII